MTTTEKILAAARDAFDEAGAARFSLRDVAKRAGLTPMAIYRHFDNRQALIDALMREALEIWRRRVEAIAPCDPERWLLKMADAYLDFALLEPRRFEAAFLTTSPSALRYPDDFLRGGSPVVNLQLRVLGELLGARPRAAADALLVLSALSRGLVAIYQAGRFAGGEKQFRSLYRRAMTQGLSAIQSGSAARSHKTRKKRTT